MKNPLVNSTSFVMLVLGRRKRLQHRGIVISHVPPAKRHPYDQWSPDARALDLVGDKWTLLMVRDLASGPRRFVELQRVLPGISTEQLRSRLNRMGADGMLTRQRYREVPPRVDYELTPRARELMPVLAGLVQPSGASGTIEFSVTGDGDGESAPAYTLTRSDGQATIEERVAERPDA